MNLDKNKVLNAPHVIWHTAGEDACDWATSPVRNKRAHQHTTLVTESEGHPESTKTCSGVAAEAGGWDAINAGVKMEGLRSVGNAKRCAVEVKARWVQGSRGAEMKCTWTQ